MAWWESVVRIGRGGSGGSGVFIGADLILTAAHVVQPMGSPPPDPGEIEVVSPARGAARSPVRHLEIHERWKASNFLPADMALIRVKRAAGVGLGFWRQFGADGNPHEVALYGYPVDLDRPAYNSGFIRVEDDPSDARFRVIMSNSFDVRPGLSGAPFVTRYSDGNVYVTGIATWDSHDPTAMAFNGLPLLPSTYEELLRSIP